MTLRAIRRGRRRPAWVALAALIVVLPLLACEDPAAEVVNEAQPGAAPLRVAFVPVELDALVEGPGPLADAAEPVQRDPADALGQGACLLDADGDGRLDVFLPGGAGARPGRLLRNAGAGHFEDVSARAIPGSATAGRGCAVADVDGDGDADLYVTALGANVLLLGDGQGRFRDASAGSGVADRRWSTGAAFGDLDGDGHLDLVVVNYLDREGSAPPPRRPPWHRTGFAARLPGGHLGASAAADALYRGRGDGTFEDVTESSGFLLEHARQGLAVLLLDADGDGDLDVHVVNDSEPDALFVNDGQGHFAERGLLSGIALAEDGRALSGAAAFSADLDGDLLDDVLVTTAEGESLALSLGDGRGGFRDAATLSGLVPATTDRLAWGACPLDVDQDGQLDLLVASGERLAPRSGSPAAPGLQLLRQTEAGHFEDVSAGAGPAFGLGGSFRAVACGDLDGDGDVDAIVTRQDGAPLLLRNDTTGAGHGIALTLAGRAGGVRDALGARVVASLVGGEHALATLRPAGGWQGGGEQVLRFGLGPASGLESVEVNWPGGRVDRFGPLAGGRAWRLTEGGRRPRRMGAFEPAPQAVATPDAVSVEPGPTPAASLSIAQVAAWVVLPEGFPEDGLAAEAQRYLWGGRTQEAMGWAASAALRNGDDALAWEVLGIGAAQRRNVELSVEAFRRALALAGDRADLRLRLGELLVNAHRPAEALEVLQEAVARSPEDAPAHWLLGLTLAELGRTPEAATVLEHVAEVAERKAAVLHRLGLVLLSAGELERAEDAFARCLIAEPTFHGARYGLLQVAARRGGGPPDEARLEQVAAGSRLSTALARALGRAHAAPADATRRLEAGLLLEQAGRVQEALVELEAAGQAQPRHVEAPVSYARLCRRLGRYGRALEALTAAETEFGASALVALESARLQQTLGNADLAASILEATAAPGGRTLDVEEELTRVRLAQGQEGAAAALEAARRAQALGSRDFVLQVRALLAGGEREAAERLAAERLPLADGAGRADLRAALAGQP